MTYQEAIEKSLTVEWKVGTCHQGEQCWCRTIEVVEPILFDDGDLSSEYYVVRGGEVHKETVEYLVKLHNGRFNTKEK